MRPLTSAPSTRRGKVLLVAIILLPALCGLTSLPVDFGRVQLAKAEL